MNATDQAQYLKLFKDLLDMTGVQSAAGLAGMFGSPGQYPAALFDGTADTTDAIVSQATMAVRVAQQIVALGPNVTTDPTDMATGDAWSHLGSLCMNGIRMCAMMPADS